MANAQISSSFVISIEGNDLNTGVSFVAPRAFEILEITAFNAQAAATTVTVVGSTAGTVTATTAAPPIAGAGIVQAQAQVGPTAPVSVLKANSQIVEGETVTITAGDADVIRVILHCVAASGGESLTMS